MSRKPMLSVDGLVCHLIDKGIKFDIMSVEDAKEYLGKNVKIVNES